MICTTRPPGTNKSSESRTCCQAEPFEDARPEPGSWQRQLTRYLDPNERHSAGLASSKLSA